MFDVQGIGPQGSDAFSQGSTQAITSDDARMLVLELTVSALVAQLPPHSLEEVAGLLCFVAGSTEETADFASDAGEPALGHLRHWADQMLQRVMTSRKASREDRPEDRPEAVMPASLLTVG